MKEEAASADKKVANKADKEYGVMASVEVFQVSSTLFGRILSREANI